jgi:hypothetical protein
LLIAGRLSNQGAIIAVVVIYSARLFASIQDAVNEYDGAILAEIRAKGGREALSRDRGE